MRPKSDGILESSLYVSDLSRSIRFYQDILGFPVISDFGERGCAMQAGGVSLAMWPDLIGFARHSGLVLKTLRLKATQEQSPRRTGSTKVLTCPAPAS